MKRVVREVNSGDQVVEMIHRRSNGVLAATSPEVKREPSTPGKWQLDWNSVRRVSCELSINQRVIGDDSTSGNAGECLRLLKHRIQRLRETRPVKVLAVTSAAPREGKTIVSTNLALVLARTSSRVLLIQGDMRRGGVGDILPAENGPGLAECLAGRASFADSVCRLDPVGLYVLPAGEPVDNPADLLQGPQLAAFLQSSREAFDWLIIDTPPVLMFADAQCLATLADGVVLVARAGQTRPAEFEQTVQALRGMFIAGTVLNGYERSAGNGYYAYYPGRRRSPAAARAAVQK